MTDLAVLQSSYLPWKGYFDIIRAVDTFVFYDDVQYTKNDWRNRNVIKTTSGPQWLTVPVGQKIDRLICEVEIKDHRWQRQHWTAIRQAYSKSPHFHQYAQPFADLYNEHKWTSLTDLNRFIIELISRDILGVRTRFLDSREFELPEGRHDRLLSLLKQCGASRYLSGPSARSYIEESEFKSAGIEVVWMDYSDYPEYPQRFPPFEHRVSIIDLLFNTGKAAREYMKPPTVVMP